MKELNEYINQVLYQTRNQTKLIICDFWDSRHSFFIFTMVFLLICGANIFFISIMESLGIFKFTRTFTSSVASNFLFGIMLLYALRKTVYIGLYKHELMFSISGIILPVFLFSSYYFVYREKMTLSGNVSIYIWHIFYADIFFLSLSILFAQFKPFKVLKPTSNKFGLYEDYYNFKTGSDKLKRKEIAKNIAEVIENTTTENSFAISIIGEWGKGKSTFIRFITEELKKNPENVIIEFNPWRTSKTEVIVKEFFTLVISEVEKFDQDLKSKLVFYTKELTGKLNPISEYFSHVFRLLSNSDIKSIGDSNDEIKKAIASSGRRFIVFIDDLDRLNGNEVIEILRIIRNNANFNNFFFITGFDSDYIQQVLKKSKSLALEHNYTKKIFQLEFVLAPINSNELFSILEQIIENDKQLKGIKIEISSILRDINNLTDFIDALNEKTTIQKQIFESPRDCIRFINSLKIALKMTEPYIILKDIIILEILKNRFSEVYVELAKSEKIFEYKQPDEYGNVKIGIKSERIVEIAIQYPYIKDYQDFIIKLLNRTTMGINSTSVSFNSLAFDSNKGVYYRYLTEGIIEKSEMDSFWEMKISAQLEMVKKWISEERTKNLLSFVLNKREYKNDEEFLNYLNLLANLATTNESLIREFSSRIRNYQNPLGIANNEKLRIGIVEIIKDIRIDSYVRGLLANEVLRICIKPTLSNSIFNSNQKVELQAITLDLLKQQISEVGKLNYKLFRYYYNNYDIIDPMTEQITLTEDANRLFKEFIIHHKEDYLKMQLRQYTRPFDGTYVFEPFLRQTFGVDSKSWVEEFENYIDSFDKDKFLKDFMKRSFDKYKQNNFNPIKLDDSDTAYLLSIQNGFIE